MLIGYARVSTGEQTLDLQLDALAEAGCEKAYTETASGAKAERPVLADVLGYLRPGDTLVVWRLDRLGRSLQHLIETITELHDRGIGFKSLTEQDRKSTRLNSQSRQYLVCRLLLEKKKKHQSCQYFVCHLLVYQK